jgi:peptidoglycan lytic transglycosylase G
MMSFFQSKILRLVLLCVLLLVLCVSLYFWRWLNSPLSTAVDAPSTIELVSGDSLYRVGHRYRSALGLNYLRVWIAYAQLVGLTEIKRGEYELSGSLTPVELLRLLNSGAVKQRTVTLVEGIRLADALDLFNAVASSSVTSPVTPAALRKTLGITQQNPEGWLYPDTYSYSKQTKVWDLIAQSHKKMKSVLAEEWQGRAEGLPYESAYEALIMASIVEKETGVEHERAAIAGVFVRRLEKRMRLQTDPTVIYGLGAAYKGDIKRSHLRKKTAYNTYTMHGLPPTPIALPGREAIHAALHPAAGDSLYFVAKGDGSHQFSVTLAEHEAAVKKYQLNRNANYRSSQ